MGEKVFPYLSNYRYYVECVNLPENGRDNPGHNDYSACPVSTTYRQRLDASQTRFISAQNPSTTRTIAVRPVAVGGLVDVALYNGRIHVDLLVRKENGQLVVDDTLHKGALDTSSVAVAFQPKPSQTPKTAATPAAGPPAADPARATRVIDVPWYHQAFELSCESAALRMILAKEGIESTDKQIMDLIGYETRGPVLTSTGFQWGDPYTAFVGDPSGSEVALTGYGTYYPTIQAAAGRLGGHVLQAGENLTPATLYGAVLNGHPAVAWVTYRWEPGKRQDYVAFDGRGVPYAGPVEHAVAVIGVRPDAVLINDPWNGQGWIAKPTFETAYAVYGQMAVVLD